MGPSVWIASDGRAGIERQALAIAWALGEPHRWAQLSHIVSEAKRPPPIRLDPKPPQTWLPPDRWPAPLKALSAETRTAFAPPWPTVFIGSGRRSVPYSLWLKKQAGAQTYVVQTQDPKATPDRFDLVIPPEHDHLAGKTVMPILGSPVYFADADIEDAGQTWAGLSETAGKPIAVVLGGTSKTHAFTEAAAARLEAQLRALTETGVRLWITASRRTPEHARIRFRTLVEETGGIFWENEAVDGPNPYLGFLLYAQAAIVTEDSTNMLCDAAWFGLPVHIAKLDAKRASKFDHLHARLIETGRARRFEGGLSFERTEPLREVERVADKIVDDLLDRFPRQGT